MSYGQFLPARLKSKQTWVWEGEQLTRHHFMYETSTRERAVRVRFGRDRVAKRVNLTRWHPVRWCHSVTRFLRRSTPVSRHRQQQQHRYSAHCHQSSHVDSMKTPAVAATASDHHQWHNVVRGLTSARSALGISRSTSSKTEYSCYLTDMIDFHVCTAKPNIKATDGNPDQL